MKSPPSSESLAALSAKPSRISRSWIAGTAAATGAVLGGSADAKPVQIDLGTSATSLNNNLDTNTLDPDLTGDGNADLMTFDVSAFSRSGGSDPDTAGVKVVASATYFSFSTLVKVGFITGAPGSGSFDFRTLNGSTSIRSPIITDVKRRVPVKFTDRRINSGRQTEGWLEVSATNNSESSHTLIFVRLIFDDASVTRPADPGADNLPAWVDPFPPLRQKLNREIRKKKKALRRAKRAGRKPRIRRLRKQLKRARSELRRLS